LPEDAIISDLEVRPDDSKVVLAATSRGIYRSDDAGQSWRRSSEGLPERPTWELSIAASQPEVVYCTVWSKPGAQPWNGGVYRSDDGGKSWRPKLVGLPKLVGKPGAPAPMTSNYKEIVVDPRDANRVYVGGTAWVTAGVYRTTDGGEHWEWCSRHHGDRKNMDYGWITNWGPAVKCLTISPVAPDRLYFGTSGHVFRTDDGGETWRQVYTERVGRDRWKGNGLEVTCMFNLVIDPFDRRRLYCCYNDIGLLISEDGGESFRRSREGMKNSGNCFMVVVDPEHRDTLWATTGQWSSNVGDVCKSRDRGQTWSVVGRPETGLPNGQTKTLLLNPASPRGKRRLFVAVNGHGVYFSDDGGESWKNRSQGLGEAPAVRGLVLVPRVPETLYVAVAATKANPLGGIYRSTDAGERWERINESLDFPDVKSLRRDERNGALYVTAREMYNRYLERPRLFKGGLYRSRDDGKTWECLKEHQFASCMELGPRPEILYLGTTDHPYHDRCQGDGVWKSKDGGRTWQQENEGLTDTGVSVITLDRTEPTTIYVGTGGNGLFKGRDRANGGR